MAYIGEYSDGALHSHRMTGRISMTDARRALWAVQD